MPLIHCLPPPAAARSQCQSSRLHSGSRMVTPAIYFPHLKPFLVTPIAPFAILLAAKHRGVSNNRNLLPRPGSIFSRCSRGTPAPPLPRLQHPHPGSSGEWHSCVSVPDLIEHVASAQCLLLSVGHTRWPLVDLFTQICAFTVWGLSARLQ